MRAHQSLGVADTLREFEKIEDQILEELTNLRKLKRIVIERFGEHQGTSPDDTAVIMNRQAKTYEEAILNVLQEAGRRLTFKPLCDALAADGYKPHPITIKRYLKSLMRAKRIDNSQEADPPGYGLIQ